MESSEEIIEMSEDIETDITFDFPIPPGSRAVMATVIRCLENTYYKLRLAEDLGHMNQCQR